MNGVFITGDFSLCDSHSCELLRNKTEYKIRYEVNERDIVVNEYNRKITTLWSDEDEVCVL